jgi:hypothetical protein
MVLLKWREIKNSKNYVASPFDMKAACGGKRGMTLWFESPRKEKCVRCGGIDMERCCEASRSLFLGILLFVDGVKANSTNQPFLTPNSG